MKILMITLLMVFPSFTSLADNKGSGAGCGTTVMGPQGYQKAAQLAAKVLDYLEDKYQTQGTKVVLLGRAGSASPASRFVKRVSEYWHYTHAGLAYRNHADGRWTIVHLLNDCGKQSNIYAQSLMKFFLDDPFEYRVVIGIPEEQLQEQLELLIVERNMATALFNNSVYSSVSNPFNTKRQNSNEYILDTLILAQAYQNGVNNLFTREQAKDYMNSAELKRYIEPEQVKVGGLESFGMAFGFGPKNVTLDDHPRSQRKKGRVEMVSVGTLLTFLENQHKLLSTAELALSQVSRATDTVYRKP